MLLRSLIAALILVPAGIAVAADGEERVAEVTGDKVRLRAGPSTRTAILGQVNRGDLVVVTGEEGAWRRARVPGGFPCFVHTSLVRRDPDGTAVVAGSRVLLRPSAGKDLPPLETVLKRGEIVTVLAEEGEWLKVLPPERVHVWVYGEYLKDLGPLVELRARVRAAAVKRRKALLGDKPERDEKKAEAAKRKAHRERVVAIGVLVLAGEGETAKLSRELTGIAIQSDDDLTRSYASSLLALLSQRREVEKLKAALEAAERANQQGIPELREKTETLREDYEKALERAQVLRDRRERPFRGTGTIERRDDGIVLVDRERLVFRLRSNRFRLEDYVGKRVGVNGRMIVTDTETGETHLMVEKLEIQPGGGK